MFKTRVFLALCLLALAVTSIEAQKKCSKAYGPCNTYSDCCRHLNCLFYAHKCVPAGPILDPNDPRPTGDENYAYEPEVPAEPLY